MPPTIPPNSAWFANLLAQLKQQAAASATQSTVYTIDPTITNPSATTPNCTVIQGDVTHDNFNNATGLPASGRSKWGIAVYNTTTKAWVQL